MGRLNPLKNWQIKSEKNQTIPSKNLLPQPAVFFILETFGLIQARTILMNQTVRCTNLSGKSERGIGSYRYVQNKVELLEKGRRPMPADSYHRRRLIATVNPYMTNLFHLRNPFIIAWWSASFPGFGHVLLGKYITGILLMVWEIFANNMAHLNEGIFYSMTGRTEKAVNVMNEEWLWLYAVFYVFIIWDSYRQTIEFNKYYILSIREGSPLNITNISAMEISILEKKKPFLALFWSLMAPGLGHFYLNRLPAIVFGVFLWMITAYFAGFYKCLFYSFTGDFELIQQTAEPQWFLFLPSIYVFLAYDSYVNAVEHNKLFDRELEKHVKSRYQHSYFKMPL